MTSFESYLRILGFTIDDESDAAEIARTWINATLDADEDWFEKYRPNVIRAAFQRWLNEVYRAS